MPRQMFPYLNNCQNMFTLKLYFVFFASVGGRYGGNVQAQDASHLVVEDSYWCKDVPEQKIELHVHPKDFYPGFQLVDINMTIPANIENPAVCRAVLDYNAISEINDSWLHLIDIEGELCSTLYRYMGDFWYDIQTAMGMMRRSCPFPRGSFHAVGHRLDFQKLKLQTFPVGKTRVRIEILTEQEILSCVMYILSRRT